MSLLIYWRTLTNIHRVIHGGAIDMLSARSVCIVKIAACYNSTSQCQVVAVKSYLPRITFYRTHRALHSLKSESLKFYGKIPPWWLEKLAFSRWTARGTWHVARKKENENNCHAAVSTKIDENRRKSKWISKSHLFSQRDLLGLQVSPNRRCLNQLNSWSEHEAAVNGATIAPPPRVSEKVSCPLGKRSKGNPWVSRRGKRSLSPSKRTGGEPGRSVFSLAWTRHHGENFSSVPTFLSPHLLVHSLPCSSRQSRRTHL